VIIAIASLAITALVHLAGAVWWASRMSEQLAGVVKVVEETRKDIAVLRGEVQRHDTAIAVMRALDAADRHSNGAGHP
jgi:hypothetical protein